MTGWTIAAAGSLPDELAGRLDLVSTGRADIVVTDRVRADLPRGRVLVVTCRRKSTVPELESGLDRTGAETLVLLPPLDADDIVALLSAMGQAADPLAALEGVIAGREHLTLGRDDLASLSPDDRWLRSEDSLGHESAARPGGEQAAPTLDLDRFPPAMAFPDGIDLEPLLPEALLPDEAPHGGQHARPPLHAGGEGLTEVETEEPARAAAPRPESDDETEPEKADKPDDRLLQCYVSSGKKGAARDNIVRAGRNAVDVFVGPPEKGSLAGPAAPDTLLGFVPGVESVTVTVVLTPLRPGAKPASTDLVIPRTGRSADARLKFTIPKGVPELRAQLMVLAGNRVIQSAVLVAKVGHKARLTERLVLWPTPATLPARVPFDGAAVATSTASGPALVTHADGVTSIEPLPEVTAGVTRIRHLVASASQEDAPTPELAASLDRRLLIDIAVEGNDLFHILAPRLGPLLTAQRIQLVTARAGAFLPLELLYDRPAPDANAALCAVWLAGGECGADCFASPTDTSVVCPHVFWGLSRVIERHQAPLEGVAAARLVADASASRTRLTLGRTAVAASQIVDDADVAALASALGTKVVRVATWSDWVTTLAAEPTPLLVLMPHNDDMQGLEVAGEFLRRGRIEAPYVTGGHVGLAPAVLLLGCDTAGSQTDPAGFATRFMESGAGVVFSTFTPVLGSDAAEVGRRLASTLLDGGRPEQPVADVLRAVRRQAVRDGFPVALAVTAYGDADWTV